MAFSAEENAAIRETLLREARRCAVTLGLRKTSVEQLTEAAGISKGLFYKYFASKELLFFEVLEDIHSEVYQVAEQALEEGNLETNLEERSTCIMANTTTATRYISATFWKRAA